jgi:aspartyl-tRNA(Asn)/glutamyl-tRNA(Gln) amidotransferase subunit B
MTFMSYKTTIGLEIHAELKTKTKMFCACLNESASGETKPNANVCPICMGHPGTLPVANKEAMRSVLKVGVAIGSNVADFTEFDRKNYFYPDIPKGYQISQYKYPLVSGGALNGVELTRIHLEEDTARSSHDEAAEGEEGFSLVDFNRAGVPLMELVTEPVINSAKQASEFARELQLLLRTLDVANAEMSRGEMRVEANISVSKEEGIFGTKVEVKNLNSFKSVEKAIEYEVARHIELIEKGEKIVQETRGWDENKQKTFSQRQKEDSHDYRYFPDPDIPKFKLSLIPEFAVEEIKKTLPELPWEKRKRYSEEYKLSSQHIEFFVADPVSSKYFDEIARGLSGDEIQLASNYIAVDVAGLSLKETFKRYPTPKEMVELVKMIKKGDLSSRGAKDILVVITESEIAKDNDGADLMRLAEEKGLIQKSDSGEIEKMLREIIENNPSVVADYRAGKDSALMFFVGQVMKASKGSANPQVAREIALKLLK